MRINLLLRETFKTRPRPVPPPGAIASASLPGYRRAGVGAGCVDPLPPTAPPRHVCGPRKAAHLGVLGRLSRSRFKCTRFANRPASPALLAFRALRAVDDRSSGPGAYAR